MRVCSVVSVGICIVVSAVLGPVRQTNGQWCGSRTWTNREHGPKGGRASHAMAFDSARGVLVLFGGTNDQLEATGIYLNGTGETWEWNGERWSLRSTTGPSARLDHVMAYDSVRGVTVLFGGQNGTNPLLGDTWEWNGAQWSVRATTGPPARRKAVMAYDSSRGVCVLWGGHSVSDAASRETWEWNGNSWVFRSSSGPDPSTWKMAMAYDSARSLTVLRRKDETWEWDGTAWVRRVTPIAVDRPYHESAIAFDASSGTTVLLAGFDAIGWPDPKTWGWDGHLWTMLNGDSSIQRASSAAVYDSVRGAVLAYGGANSIYDPSETILYDFVYDDLLMWNGSCWNTAPGSNPTLRIQHAMAYDAARNEVVLYGGRVADGGNGFFADTWVWKQNRWVRRDAPGPGGRFGHAMAYDHERQTIVLVGGRHCQLGADCLNWSGGSGCGPPGHQTWEWDGDTWVLRHTGSPGDHEFHAMTYDKARTVTVLFGGFSAGQVMTSDTWEWDGTDWTLRTSSGPSARYGHGMAYDSVRNVTLLFGGIIDRNDPNQRSNELWEWDGDTWWQVPMNGPWPAARADHMFAFDEARGVAVLFGGEGVSGGLTWEWDGSTWSAYDLTGPVHRRKNAMVYDSYAETIVLFGAGNGDSNSVWTYPCEPRPSAPVVTGDDRCVWGSFVSEIPCSTEDECAGIPCWLKNRFISVDASTDMNPAPGEEYDGLQVTLVDLHLDSVADPAMFAGQHRWAGPISLNISDGLSPPFNVAELQCKYDEGQWAAVGPVHLFGSAIVPASRYEIRLCITETGPCSSPLRIETAKFGDVVTPLNTVNFQDVNSIVAKFQGTPAGPSKTRTKLANSTVNPASPINFQEVSACVSAFQGKAFKTVVTTPPATCP